MLNRRLWIAQIQTNQLKKQVQLIEALQKQLILHKNHYSQRIYCLSSYKINS